MSARMISMKRGVVKALLHMGAWMVGAAATALLFRHSGSWLAYGLLSGWWCALYCGYVFRVERSAVLPAGVLYLAARIVAAGTGLDLVYHDSPPLLSLDFVSTVVLGSVIFISPILVNELPGLRRGGQLS